MDTEEFLATVAELNFSGILRRTAKRAILESCVLDERKKVAYPAGG
jgi:hypothetical protein